MTYIPIPFPAVLYGANGEVQFVRNLAEQRALPTLLAFSGQPSAIHGFPQAAITVDVRQHTTGPITFRNLSPGLGVFPTQPGKFVTP